MNSLFRLITLLFAFVLAACTAEEPPSDAPTGLTATAGESLALLNWDVVAGRTYWIYYKAGSSVSSTDYDNILYNQQPPYLVRNLSNATEYAFTLTSSQNGSPVGPFTAAVTATPRLLSPSVDWTVGTSLTTNALHSISYSSNFYVTVGDAASLFVGTYSYAASGGVSSWTQVTSLPITGSTDLTAVAFDGLRFVALGSDGAVIKSTSSDVLSWAAGTAISGATSINALAVGAGRYVAVGNAGEIYTNNTDGVTAAWTQQSSPTGNDLYAVRFINSRFVAVGAAGTVLTSTDGVVWTEQTAVTSNALRQVAYGAGNYVAVGDADTVITSTDAVTWNTQAAFAGGESLRGITFGPDNQFIAVGTAGTLAYSATGADGSWAIANAGSADLNSIAPNLVFIAVGAGGGNVSGK